MLVDKVLSRSSDWVLSDKHMDEIRDAAFNVIVPRAGGEDMARVARVAGMARERGMFYMAWMRGSLAAETETKVAYHTGGEESIYSPNADELWEWMTRLLLGHAKLSVENPAIIGTFLDFENYADGPRLAHCYSLSYDDKIVTEFAESKGLKLPVLKLARRHAWLEENGHLAAFREFQLESWRRRCRKVREQIDAVNPRFQLVVYPMGTLLLNEAIYAEWATERASLILADHCTYGRPGHDVLHGKALEINGGRLERGMAHARETGAAMLYMGGFDPICTGADPEFLGKSAAMVAEMSNGYWVFYEGPDYHSDHADYFKWFARANRAIMAGRFGLWREPRETPDSVLVAREKYAKEYCGAAVKPYTREPMPEGAGKVAFTIRGKARFGLMLKAGEKLEGRLEVQRLGGYTAGSDFLIRDTAGREVAAGKAEINEPAVLSWAAQKAGLHVIAVNTGANAARLRVDNQYFCLIMSGRMGFLEEQPRAYFIPADGPGEAWVELWSPSPAETAMLTLYDSAGREYAKGDTVRAKTYRCRLTVSAEQAGRPWSILLTKPPEGYLEDMTLELSPKCLAYLATHPTRLLRSAE